jgi:hypothetical protein
MKLTLAAVIRLINAKDRQGPVKRVCERQHGFVDMHLRAEKERAYRAAKIIAAIMANDSHNCL